MTYQAVFTCCVCFAEHMMRMYQQFPRTLYVSPYGLGFILLCCQEAAFSNHKIVHGLPSPSFSHPELLKFWCSRNERWRLVRTRFSSFCSWSGSVRFDIGSDVGDLGTLFGGWGCHLRRACVSPGLQANPCSSLRLFCHVPLKRDQSDWDWRIRLNDIPNATIVLNLGPVI